MQVLVVDDDDFALSVVERTMTRMGYSVTIARDGRAAIEILRRGEIHLVITDWDMPEMNGVDLCRAVRHEDLSGYVYIIMLTGREGAQQRMEGLCAGADDFLNKPLDPEELLVCLKTAERILALETRDLALFALAKLAESRDVETGAHVERVQSYTRLIAQYLSKEVKAYYGVDDEYIRLLHQTSPLHDLGKVAIPDAVLLKAGKLTPEEFAIMKTHTVLGAQTLDAALSRFPNARFLQIARQIAATHHEKFDGTGYPQGLAGEQIPLCGRIVAVADVYDALTSRRVYKEAMTHEQSRAIILKDRGRHFDSEVVDAFLRAEAQIVAIRERLRDDTGEVPQQVSIPAPPPVDQAAAGACRILIAEDDPVLLAKLIELLTATGEPVCSATNGKEAMKTLENFAPHVVVSDWVMPEVGGVELCRYIRGRADAEPVHFIMLTAHSEKSRLLEAYDAGVDDFVSKPFQPEELLARVRAGIRAAKLHETLVRKATGSQVLNSQLATLNSRLEKLVTTDELTGLFNRRHAMRRLEEQWELYDRYGRSLTIAMIDIDHFKKINDTWGHAAGDSILSGIAEILRDHTRGTDTVCRVGGEEFLIIFPSQTIAEAAICAERFRNAVAAHPFVVAGANLKTTVSIGLAGRTSAMAQFPDLLQAADQALYAAKHAGRNIVRRAEETGASSDAAASALNAVVKPGENITTETASVSAPGSVQMPTPVRAPIDEAALLERCGGDPVFAAAVTQRFETQALAEIDKIESALASGDADHLMRAAHSLKSMAAYMSATMAVEIATRIESSGHRNQLAEVSPLLGLLRAEVESAIEWISQDGQSGDRRRASCM